jgi:hypothetical protein
VGPASVLDQHDNGTPARLAFAGIELSLDEQDLERFGDLSVFRPTESPTDGVHPWPKGLLRAPTEPEDCLLFADLGNHPIPLSRGRFSVVDSQWTIDPAVAIGADFLGGALVSRQDGALVGLIDMRDDRPIVLPIPEELVEE